MKAWWQLWETRFVQKTCDDLVKAALEIQPQEGVVGFGDRVRNDSNLRRSKIRWPNIHKRPFVGLVEQLNDIFHEANRNAYGFELWNLHEVQFTEYNAAEKGHYNWHEDLDWANDSLFHRKLSMVMQLSDPATYEGGDLELQHETPPPDRLRKQGSVIVFPSFHRHRVTPITKGVRYSIVAWYTGPKFR